MTRGNGPRRPRPPARDVIAETVGAAYRGDDLAGQIDRELAARIAEDLRLYDPSAPGLEHDLPLPDLDPAERVAAPPSKERFRFYADETWAALPSPPWLVERWLPAGQFAVLFGTSGIGKSFVALDLAYAVARGVPWLGQRVVTPGQVVYVAGEAAISLRTRCRAYRQHYGVQGPLPLQIVPDVVRLGEPTEVTAFASALIERYPNGIQLLIFDTWAAALAGLLNEKDTQETSRAIEAVETIQRVSGATPLVIHHTGWLNQERERGSYALRAHVAVSLNLGVADGAMRLSAVKTRDDVTPDPIPVRLVATAGSAIIGREDRPTEQRPLTELERTALRCLHEIGGQQGVSAHDWAQASGLPHGSFYRARQRLVQFAAVLYERRRYHVTPLGESVL